MRTTSNVFGMVEKWVHTGCTRGGAKVDTHIDVLG